MRTVLALTALLLLASPAFAQQAKPYAAPVCKEIARLGDALSAQAEKATGKAPDMQLFSLVDKDIRRWLEEKCFPACDSDAKNDDSGSLTELADSCK